MVYEHHSNGRNINLKNKYNKLYKLANLYMMKLMNETSLVQHSLQFSFNPVRFSVKFKHNSDLTLFHLKVSDTGVSNFSYI